MFQKIYNIWSLLKQTLEKKDLVHFFYEKEIWWIHMGKNIGFEQDGKNNIFLRPVVIIKKFNKDLFWGIPLTTKNKKGKYYFQFTDINGVKENAILSQTRPYSSKRLKNKLGEISNKDFQNIKKAVKRLL